MTEVTWSARQVMAGFSNRCAARCKPSWRLLHKLKKAHTESPTDSLHCRANAQCLFPKSLATPGRKHFAGEDLVFAIPRIPAGGPIVRFGSVASFEAFGICDGSVKLRVGACGYLLLDTQGQPLSQGWQRIKQPTLDTNCAEF
jgi:hypothetical protein